MKMSAPWPQSPAEKLPGVLLYLYELSTHISRGLEADFMGELTGISHNILQSTLR